MKTYITIIFIGISIFFTSCTDVIDVNVPTADPRLVIEASLDWEKGTSGNEQTITLSTSTKYFEKIESNIVTGASVKVTNDNDDTEFIFIDQNNGKYTTTNFIPVLNQSYTLEIIYNNETYIAKETMTPVVDIAAITQSTEDGDDDEALEVNVIFNDPKNEENFYFIKFREKGGLLPELYNDNDEFTNGNQMTLRYEKEEDDDINQEEFKPNDVVDISFHGVSKGYYDYISIFIDQIDAGGPFGTTPVPLRGNCTNSSNPKNYAFGYFRLTQVIKTSYTFQ
ncbi:DUF4249 domain-containing protein [Aquimarina muelleri]|uniref:DUF4249 domain-containing protein n=1 Tax=Aquimarina muelleri TaxID=279356 RepID=A0A918N3Q1_9FLAO|nr:DUF4249 domain-containing protein [Aquimarina muelleri]MCX2763357.1 DUF4249 domain-containing protein [Aquimarina muelleri]GGX28480.1 hypothetical protein GCM10007384_32100 [Aquimarina muelleri]